MRTAVALQKEDIMQGSELKGVDGRMPEALTEGININLSDIETLASIGFIGAARAERIIDYRDKNGSFTSWEELKNAIGFTDDEINALKGIGALLEGVPEEGT